MADLVRNSDGSYTRHSASDQDDKRWINAADPASALWATVRSLRNRQSWRRQSDELALLLYSDMRYIGYRARSGAHTLQDVLDSRMGDNVIRSIVRVLNSKIARRRSRPYVTTNDGKFRARTAAENLEKWLLGKFREVQADTRLFPLFRTHALVLGTGIIRSYGDPFKGAMLEVIPSNEVVVDDSEARYGEPRNMYFVRVVDAGVLKARYPDKKVLIDEAVSKANVTDEWAQGVGAFDQEASNDLLVTIEAIHLPSSPEAHDGRWVLSVNAGVLFDVEWKRDHFPIAVMRGELRPAGFWGIGVPEDLAGAQIEINRTSLARREMIDLLAAPYWLIEKGMKVVKSHISNLIGRVMEWTPTGSGNKPELVSPQAVPQDVWTHTSTLKAGAFESRGVSQLSAQMLKPMGLNSGKALRAYTELEAELLTELMAEYEASLLKVCELLIEEQMELAENSLGDDENAKRFKEHAVSYVGEGTLEQIKWNDINLKRDLENYAIEILPASALASTLSARIEDVYDLRDLGIITDVDETHDYLELPDRRRLRKKHLSHRHLLEKVIEHRILERGEDVIPEPTWDLAYAVELGLKALNELELYEDAPADRAELLRVFIKHCQTILKMGAPAPDPMTNGLPDPTAALGADPGLGGAPPIDPALAGGPAPGAGPAGAGSLPALPAPAGPLG